MAKSSYHSSLRIAHGLGVLPDLIKKQIPRPTLTYWNKTRNVHIKSYGYDPANTEYAQELMGSRLWPVVVGLLKANRLLRKAITLEPGARDIYQNISEEVVCFVSRKAGSLREKMRFLDWLGISRNRFDVWANRIDWCESSLINLCRKYRPNQLTVDDIKTLLRYLSDDRYKSWSLINIYYRMLDDGTLFIGRSTFYKYAALLGIKRRFKKWKIYGKSIRAKRPGQVLHADVSVFKLANRAQVFLHVLIDNFSRKILKCEVSDIKSAAITCENIKSVMIEYPVILGAECDLIVDGGSENKGELDLLIAEKSSSLKKIVALKDVVFSNSMVEATNKILKNNYLLDHKFTCVDSLQEFLDGVLLDFNSERNNAQLYGLTPDRAFAGEVPDPDRFKAAIMDARYARVMENQEFPCGSCSKEMLEV